MSLDTVVDDIREEARARAEEIRADAEERAEEIRQEARADAEEIRAEAEREVDRQIAQEREQELSSAKLEAKQARLEARRSVLEDVREEVEDRIEAIDGDQRRELTETLLDAAAEEFGGFDDVAVYSRPDDAALVEELIADRDGYERAGDIECLGGVVVESDASRVRVNNTFDSVLEDVWDDHLRDVSNRLFESTEQ